MKKLIVLFAFFAPVITFAQVVSGRLSGNIDDADAVVDRLISFFNVAIYVLISFAVVYLVWLIVRYFIMADGDDRSEVLKKIGYGILALFIILSIWGLVNILVRTFGTENRVPTERIPRAILNTGGR